MTTHRPDVTGIAAGLLFVALGAVFLLDRLDVWDVRLDVVWPAALVGVGALIVLGALFRRR